MNFKITVPYQLVYFISLNYSMALICWSKTLFALAFCHHQMFVEGINWFPTHLQSNIGDSFSAPLPKYTLPFYVTFSCSMYWRFIGYSADEGLSMQLSQCLYWMLIVFISLYQHSETGEWLKYLLRIEKVFSSISLSWTTNFTT